MTSIRVPWSALRVGETSTRKMDTKAKEYEIISAYISEIANKFAMRKNNALAYTKRFGAWKIVLCVMGPRSSDKPRTEYSLCIHGENILYSNPDRYEVPVSDPECTQKITALLNSLEKEGKWDESIRSPQC